MDARQLCSPKTLNQNLETLLVGDRHSSTSVGLFCLTVSEMGSIHVSQRTSLFE